MTGLSKEGLRVWEKRYRLISPQRGSNRYRLYTEEDVNLLKYLVKEIQLGQSIGELASLGKDEILVRMNREQEKKSEGETHITGPLINDLEKSLMPLDELAFEGKLNEMMALMPFQEVFRRVLIPLQIRVGELWFEEKVSIAVEHYVTTQVKQKLFSVMSILGMRNGPKVVIACPPWDLHEIGAQMVAYHCSTLGYQTTLLGANLPVESLIHFCTRTNPDAVALSFTSSVSDNKCRAYFSEISKYILPLCMVLVGGQGINQRDIALENQDFKIMKSLHDLDNIFNNSVD